MKRRVFLSSLALLPFATASHAAPSWRARILKGGFDGKAYAAGLHIMLNPGWKTYWRNPGSAGIPPDIKAALEGNVKALEIEFPLPKRIVDESGEALGYHDEVVFPLRLVPQDVNLPVALKLSAFFGVCQQICSPAKFDGAADFVNHDHGDDAALISQWRARVPEQAEFVKAAVVSEKHVQLQLSRDVTDIFVEGPDKYYFGKPELVANAATIKVAGLKNDADLKGIELRITADAGGRGIEQRVIIS